MINTPVLFIIFNRPELVQRVLSEIKEQRPKHLYVYADGPRSNSASDYEKCMDARKIIEQQIDWDCDLHKLYRDENLGCGRGPASAISWFFDNVTEGIIIEEDCLPHPDFFGYCSELLERYRNDERIMIIGATTYRDDYPCEFSYTFSTYGIMAAWATWKRVWDRYDYTLSQFTREELKDKLQKHFYSRFEYKNWLGLYDWIVKDGFKSYWDWQLHFIVFFNSGIAIRPKMNMIRNMGIGPDATHTSYSVDVAFTANRQVFGCLPLKHPSEVVVDGRMDAIYYKMMYRPPFIKQVLQAIFLLTFRVISTDSRILHFYRRIKSLVKKRIQR